MVCCLCVPPSLLILAWRNNGEAAYIEGEGGEA